MIDWNEQWAFHSPYYRNGFLVVNLTKFYGPDFLLKLKPGPGFGDLSHPTTRLSLQLLLPLVKGKTVLDIGSGSGILALAAKISDAKEVYACDISEEALDHGKTNGQINCVTVTWSLPENLPFLAFDTLAVMNMIRSDQMAAWESLRALHSQITCWITSGVLIEEKDIYLAEVAKRGWVLKKLIEEEGWLAFLFARSF